MFILLISNHTVFLVQFGINLHLWVFQKAKLHSLKWLVQFQLFEKLTHANYFQDELETVWLPTLIVLIIMSMWVHNSFKQMIPSSNFVAHQKAFSHLMYLKWHCQSYCRRNRLEFPHVNWTLTIYFYLYSLCYYSFLINTALKFCFKHSVVSRKRNQIKSLW